MLVKSDIRYIIKRVFVYLIVGFILSFIGSCTASATIERVPPNVSYQQPNNTIFNNRVISDQHYWGIDINNLGSSNSLVWHYNYAPRYGNNVLYNYTFFLYSSYDSLNINMNGRACYTMASPEQSTATGNQSRTNTKFMVYCPNIPYSDGIDIGMYNEIVNTWGNVWSIGLSWDFDVQPMNVNDVASAVDSVNQSINDTTPVSNNDVSGNANDWASNNSDSPVINQLVLMPVTLLNAFVNGLSSTCSTYSFGTLFDTELTLPCINMSQKLGVVWTTIDVILSGVFIFIFGKRCVKIFNDFTNLRSGQIDSLYGGDN